MSNILTKLKKKLNVSLCILISISIARYKNFKIFKFKFQCLYFTKLKLLISRECILEIEMIDQSNPYNQGLSL